jgi:hypothetical protein
MTGHEFAKIVTFKYQEDSEQAEVDSAKVRREVAI